MKRSVQNIFHDDTVSDTVRLTIKFSPNLAVEKPDSHIESRTIVENQTIVRIQTILEIQ